MTTLVTGATGFVGSHVARQLVSSGQSVRALVRPDSNLDALGGLNVELFQGDLRNVSSLERAMQGVRRVFHVAADYRLWTPRPEEIYENNVEGTRKLLAAAQSAGVERIVYTSTVATIAVPRHGVLPDEDTRATLDEMIGHYKRSKFLAEQVAVEAAAAGVPVVIVNPTAPVGPWDWKPTPTGRIILDFLKGKMPAYVDTGLNVAAVEDIAAGHLLAAEKGRVGERYILGARNMTLKHILDALSAITGRPAPRVRLPHAVALAAGYADQWFSRLAGREPQIPVEGVKMSRHRMFVESDKAFRELGYKPTSVEAALERAVRWYEGHGYLAGGAGNKSVAHAAAA
ncbi:MAG TPA: hopanoid-associated sugar epimerase [Candidatus Acidoferrales bacterium]|jgi:dihydroflavonol-4-reductase|nr:hopanoid-associated sugar epimerase [Candidatus Acidoferrales bacterium]